MHRQLTENKTEMIVNIMVWINLLIHCEELQYREEYMSINQQRAEHSEEEGRAG